MAYSLFDAAVTPCVQQLGALAGIIDKAAAHCVANKIEESALLQDRLYPDMFCLARQIRQSADFAMNTGGLVDDADQCAKLLGAGGYSRVVQRKCHFGFLLRGGILWERP